MPGCLPLSLLGNILLFLIVFTLTDSESYTVDAVRCLQIRRSDHRLIVLQVEYIQLEQVKYDRRQKHYVVIDDL